MHARWFFLSLLMFLVALPGLVSAQENSQVKAWEDKLTIPTYSWENDINPKFWALEFGTKLAAKGDAGLVYPYVMQDHITRIKTDRTYKALCLENEYLKVTCLPELGGRIHSVLDKTTGKQMFHLNDTIKPGMIAMRGAWISGGIEWNTGPHGHTVTAISPVNALIGKNDDGSAYIEVSNTEQIFRTHWTVRVTLHPGRSYLDQRISIYNPTDGMHPYYFWNCTAFPNRPGTRFIFPMSLGTDHNGREFFRWPIHEGRDLTWLKNYDMYSSIFAVNCTHDFFGAYDVDADQGIVQTADHRQVSGKKAWTWGEWEFGKTAEKNLADGEAHYIEVQSGPLPTQSDYGMLGPHGQVYWSELWYPVHSLGSGFEFANRDVAVQTKRHDGKLELHILATSLYPQAQCVLKQGSKQLLENQVDLSPNTPSIVTLDEQNTESIDIAIKDKKGGVLAAFTTPLPIPKVEPPDPKIFMEKPDDQLSAEELYLKGRKFDCATDRKKAREYYEKALACDSGHVLSLRSLAVLDFEAGLYDSAIKNLKRALSHNGDAGLCWYYLGATHFKKGDFENASMCARRAIRFPESEAQGYDLLLRTSVRSDAKSIAPIVFANTWAKNPENPMIWDHVIVSIYARGGQSGLNNLDEKARVNYPMRLAPRFIRALKDDPSLVQFAHDVHSFTGEIDFEILEASLTFADLGLFDEARKIVKAVCVDAVPKAQRSFMPLYYLAWYSAKCNDNQSAKRWLEEAAANEKPYVFASRVEELDILHYAVKENPSDWQAHLQLGCLLANLGRVEEAVPEWEKAAELNPKSNIAWRNLGLAAAAKDESEQAEGYYRKAIAARPNDQTLYRDLALILIAADRRPDAIGLLESMPLKGGRRAEISMILGESYLVVGRYEDCIRLLEAAPYFVNWEGNDDTWRLFNRAHIERGRQRMEKGELKAALEDFEAALTYPANLNVGPSNKPEEAQAQYWRGKALAAMGKTDEARAAWKAGAEGFDGIKPSLETTIPSLKSVQKEYREKCREALSAK